MPHLSLHFDTDYEAVRLARRTITALARIVGATEDEAFDIAVAVGEALANARRHAYGDGIGPVQVDVAVDHEGFHLTIHDHGRPVTPPVFPTGPPPPGRGGLGLYLIRQLMDRAEFSGRTSLHLTKRLGRAWPAAESSRRVGP